MAQAQQFGGTVKKVSAPPPQVRRNRVVIKRDGREQEVHYDKITTRIARLSYQLKDCVDPSLVAQKVIPQLFPRITTCELDELSAEQAAAMSALHPDYAVLAARICVSNLHKQTNKSFVQTAIRLHEYIESKTGKPAPMIAEDVMAFIKEKASELEAAIVYERDFGYDFFGYKTLAHAYLLKIDGKIVERPQHMLMRVSCGIHCWDLASTIETYNLMSQKWFTHATPTLFNAGTPIPQLSSWYGKQYSHLSHYECLSEVRNNSN